MKRTIIVFIFSGILLSCGPAKKNPSGAAIVNAYEYSIQKKIIAANGAVVSAHPLASKVGLEILKTGGNAVDAAIATQLALAVVYPQAGNLGGGGFMVARLGDDRDIAIDYRETAPGKAGRDMYIDAKGVARTDQSQDGQLASGVPGTVAGLFESAKYGKLSFNNNGNKSSGNNSFDQYTSDPAHPVPYTEDVHATRTREYMDDDQRFAARRPDVLTYETEILDNNVTLAGPVIADLMTSISTTDADFVVKIIDVFPDDFKYSNDMKGNDKNYPMGGYQMLVRGEIMRGKFRNSFEKPEPFVPGKITEVKWELPDVAHTFLKRHRIMIQIQSSWFPLADRNPQKFLDIYKAEESDFQKANIRVYHSVLNQSKLIIPVFID